MEFRDWSDPRAYARPVGFAMLASIIVGILSAVFIVPGIDVNLTADIRTTATNMLEADPSRLYAKAYIAILLITLQALALIGLLKLTRPFGPAIAWTSFIIGVVAVVMAALGAITTMNAAEIAHSGAFAELTRDARITLIGQQVATDYTSFHFSLILSSLANAGVFLLLLRSGAILRLIAGWGLFASLFVAAAIMGRDFIPALGADAVTAAFMLANLLALISTGLYLAIRGVRAAAYSGIPVA